MTLSKKLITVAIATGFTSMQFAVAQTESFPPPPPPFIEDMNEPPPVVPSSSGAAPTAGGRETRIVAPKAGKNSVLTESQRAKFAKANPEDITSENFPETIESFDFPNVDITDIIKAISELTGKNFIIDSTVRGKITIVAPAR